MATQPRLVNKQFNSPIGLYSAQNVEEVLRRDQQILANGAIGIDFHNPTVGKPANLQNSAVLRMLEEEENRRAGRTGDGEYYPKSIRDVSWPPRQYDQTDKLRSSFKDVVTPGVKRVAWPPPQEGVLDLAEVIEHNAVETKGGPQYSNQSPGLQQNNYPPQQAASYQQPAQPSYRPLKPLDVSSVGTASPLASPALNQSPAAFRSVTPTKGWAPVQSPVTTPSGSQKSFGSSIQGYPNQPQNQPVTTHYQSNPGYQEPGRQYGQPAQRPQSFQEPGSQYSQPAQQFQPSSNQYHSNPSSWSEPGRQYGQPAQRPQSFQEPGRQYGQPVQQHQPPSNQFQSAPPSWSKPDRQYSQPAQQYHTASQYPAAQHSATHQYQSIQSQYQSSSFAHSAPSQTPSQQVAAQAQAAPRLPQAKHVEPPPSTITLRQTAPVSQAPPPVYSTQPATATLKVVVGGKHLRGDLKWPPEDVRQRMTEEKQKLEELAKGPVNRPSRKERDYSRFFAEHALNSTYPGYKIPPGTQYFRPA